MYKYGDKYVLCMLGLGLATEPNSKSGPYQILDLDSVTPNHLPKVSTVCVVTAYDKFQSVICCSLKCACPLL
jgi:hypothetical protein